MEIRLRSTGEVLNESEFRARFVQNLPPTPLTQEWLDSYVSDPAGDIVLEGPQATGGDRYQFSVRQGVEQIEGQWFTKYVLGPIFTDGETTAAEQEAAYKADKDAEKAKLVREERNRRIAALDWTQGKDIPDAVSAPAAVIRQALRDVPEQAGFPWEVTWPAESE